MKTKTLISIVEDDDCLSNKLRAVLPDAKISLLPNNIGDEDLVKRLKKVKPDLVIFNRPKLSGLEISQLINIRRRVDIPVIMVNAQRIQENEIETIRFPDQMFKIKTMSLEQLKTWIYSFTQKPKVETIPV